MSLTTMFTVHSSKSSYAVQNLIRVRTGTKKRVTTVGFSILWRLKAIRKRASRSTGPRHSYQLKSGLCGAWRSAANWPGKGGIRLVIEHPWDEERYHELEAALQRVGDRPLSLHLRQNYGDHFERHPAQDEYRSKVLLAQLESIVEAHASSINVQSIQLGPLLDEQEWSDGASPRKGLVWVDPTTDQRWPKSSALVIQRLLVEGTLTEVVSSISA